jgi:hypothetical protein
LGFGAAGGGATEQTKGENTKRNPSLHKNLRSGLRK